jgi:diguanylate cyclase (GGDEF)-like protein
LNRSYQRGVADELQQRERLFGSAHALLEQRFFIDDTTPVPAGFRMPRSDDSSWRLLDGISAVFVHKDSPPDAETLRYVYQSHDLWEQIIPLLGSSFSAVYFVSETRMTRIWPAHIVEQHQADLDVTDDIFYTIATPENNPARLPVWTPIYLDPYTNIWMISLIIPVYDGDRFVGVMGGDLEVNFLLERLASINVDDDEIKALIYDDKGEVILYSDGPNALWSAINKNVLSDVSTRFGPEMNDYIQRAVNHAIAPENIESRHLDGEQQHIGFFPIDGVNWMMSLYYPETAIAAKLTKTLVDIYINIILLTLFLTLVLYFSINYFVVQRIRALAQATSSISHKNWTVKVPEKGNDEISFLGSCINVLLLKINDLIQGLNTNIEQLEKVNMEAKKLIRAIESSTSIVVILNRDWGVEYANAQFWQASGYLSGDNLQGEQALLFDQDASNTPELDAIAAKLYADYERDAMASQSSKNDWRAEYLALRKDGSSFWMMQTISAIFSPSGEIENFIAVGHDSTDLKLNQQKMEHLAYFDQLTGLHNRVLFKDQLRSALNICQRDKTHFALMYLDLDHFKRINDTMGHEAGDALLIEVANRIKQCLREEDVVARLGGDEFAVLLYHVGSAQYAYVAATKIIAALNCPLPLLGKEVDIGVSIGITLAPDDSHHIDTLMKNADLAMYRAKEKGRNTFQFYTADMNHQVEHRLAMESDLRLALRNQEFELFYQPIVDIRTGLIVSAEALLRWRHPRLGLVSPLDFIPIAEDSGLIVPIGKWILRSACQQAKNIQKALRRPLKIAVNVSARQLLDNGFVDAFQAALKEIRVAPEWLSVELTETTLMADGDKAIERMQRLQAMGVSIAIDDFGTGYSSLSHLKRLPVNTLKIDQSFVEGLPDDEEDRAITTLIVAMANNLNYKVVVEGVETSAQLAFLTLSGCDYAQGFYFSKPLPADELMQLLFNEQTS